ncbi:formyltransferase family protein [Flavobacterium sp.]|uniref:methionyl-tRNA formyltransferase n=1 Tax=Flavobacterium sp. TaxID=239 RepID=UPI00262DFF52|nr:formyltransferase family protein [Flavobacterium sp.]
MEKTIKIVVLCGGKFAFKALQSLAIEKFLCGIGIGNGEKSIVNALENQCDENGIAFQSFQNKSSLNKMRSWLEVVNPDYIFSISFPFLITEEILSFGPTKFINFHPGPLPQYRGAMPIFEVLRNQEKETAVSVHYMNSKFDEGELLFKDAVSIEANDTFGKLAMRLSNHTAQVALNLANMLQFATKIPSNKQDENEACYYEKPELVDTMINWKRMSADEIIALINACNPWHVGADTFFDGEQIKIVNASKLEETHNDERIGFVLSTDENAIIVACSDNEQIKIDLLSSDYGIMNASQFMSFKKVENKKFG